MRARKWSFVATLPLLLLAMISRFSADFVATRNEHLMGAAISWLAAAALWAALVLATLARSEPG